MALLIAMRSTDGEKVYFNLHQVCAIHPSYTKKTTTILFAGEYLDVIESVDSIANMISYYEEKEKDNG